MKKLKNLAVNYRLLALVCLFGVMYCISSCNKEELTTSPTIEVKATVSKDQLKKQFGYAFAKILSENKDIRDIVKEEALKKINYDYDVLYQIIKERKDRNGNTIEEILNYKQEIKEEINRIENLEDYTNKLKKELKNVEDQMNIIAQKMHEERKESACKLSEEINEELIDLEMKNAKIKVNVSYLENGYLKNGKDKVVFSIITNVGEEEKELSKIASGGEMSRIMLAIKKVLAESDKMPVLVFDEIDTGISGKAANAVAKKLKAIAKEHQVMCISHLPNIAANADHNYFISKDVNNNRTKTKIRLLNENEVIEEIARISSGEINEVSLKYATELRNKKAS